MDDEGPAKRRAAKAQLEDGEGKVASGSNEEERGRSNEDDGGGTLTNVEALEDGENPTKSDGGSPARGRKSSSWTEVQLVDDEGSTKSDGGRLELELEKG